jgi:pyruvate dehydrogenase E2 component (dihydrolipoamide acetyltransferase)
LASKEIRVPDLGNFKDVAVIEVLAQPGQSVQADSPLLTLETEKATMDVPSPEAGVIEAVHVAAGTRVSAGTLIATLKVADEIPPAAAAAAAPASAPVPPPIAPAITPPAVAPPAVAPPAAAPPAVAPPAAARPAIAPAGGDTLPALEDTLRMLPALKLPSVEVNEAAFARANAGPSVRRFARELGVDLSRVPGSGKKGRVTSEDVKAFVKSMLAGSATTSGSAGGGLPRVQTPDFALFGAIEIKPLSRVQRISGPRLHASWVNLPHVTQFDEADITELEQARKSLKAKAEGAGLKLTPLAFVIRACVKALQRFPLFNTSLDAAGENLVYKQYIHVGFAADTPNGLLVPVIRNADRMDIYELARALAELSEKARAGKLGATDMQGGCFTVSSLGGIGGTAFTPIINAPEVAILGVSRSSFRPVYQDGAFVPRLMLPLCLSYDHRVIDGANGARFITYLSECLADVRALTEAVP